MNTSGEKLLLSARSRLGSSFRHHYEPVDACNGGRTTLNSCMEYGLGSLGEYDCSGLVIASLAQILKINPTSWPREYRHVQQLETLEDRRAPAAIGDVLVFHPKNTSYGKHIGILAATMSVIHASGKSKDVTEGKVDGRFSRIGVIPADKILELGFDLSQQRSSS